MESTMLNLIFVMCSISIIYIVMELNDIKEEIKNLRKWR